MTTQNNMKTHNATIYHCITCGRVEHAELTAEPPQCCGQAMAKAAGETVGEGDVAREKAIGHSETTDQAFLRHAVVTILTGPEIVPMSKSQRTK